MLQHPLAGPRCRSARPKHAATETHTKTSRDARPAPHASRRRPPRCARLPGGGAVRPVWSEFADLAREVDAKFEGGVANLGQGFPNWAPPQFREGWPAKKRRSEEAAAGRTSTRGAQGTASYQCASQAVRGPLFAGRRSVWPRLL